MKNEILLPGIFKPARSNSQQLKLIMNLPVRIVSDNKVVDFLPLTLKEGIQLQEASRRRRVSLNETSYPSLNDLISFFKNCNYDDLLTPFDVSQIYNIAESTVRIWSTKKILKRYCLTPSLALYKRSELPTISDVYGPYEL